ncbi:hypothetical protein Peur_071215 [Populus x canadensis]
MKNEPYAHWIQNAVRQLLHNGRHDVADPHDLDDDDDDELARYYISSWFKTCCTVLDML